MNVVVDFTDLLIHTEVNKEEQSEYLKVINKSSKNSTAIIDDLIEVSKIDLHQITPNLLSINLESCMSELHETIKNNSTIKGNEEGTILIAEDDNINYLLFQKIMRNNKYKIIRAENGQEAVNICISNPDIDLVLMDIKMPVMDGFEAFEKIKSIRPNLPVIAQTAFSSNDEKDEIFKVGFSDYITKPINREKLLGMIGPIFQKKMHEKITV